MTLLTTERLFWHCGNHTAEPESASRGRFLITKNLLFSVARGSTGGLEQNRCECKMHTSTIHGTLRDERCHDAFASLCKVRSGIHPKPQERNHPDSVEEPRLPTSSRLRFTLKAGSKGLRGFWMRFTISAVVRRACALSRAPVLGSWVGVRRNFHLSLFQTAWFNPRS